MTTGADDEEAFKAALAPLISYMRAFARSIAHDPTEADDIAQEALAKGWQARGSFRLGTNMKAWLFMIVRNEFYSRKRRSWRSQPLNEEVAERTLVAVDDPSARLDVHDVRRAMLMLPPEQREALTLVAAAGLSYQEAAEVADVAIGTVKSRVSRARARLQELMQQGDLGESDVPPESAAGAIFDDARRLRRAAGLR